MPHPPMDQGRSPASRASALALRLSMGLCLALLTACGGDSPETASPPVTASDADGTLHLVWFTNLYGLGEGIPCQPGTGATIPGAAGLARELEAQGDEVVLAFAGDTLKPIVPASYMHASRVGSEARADVDLDAMAAAGVDIYVPGHADMREGLADLLDCAAARDIPVVLSNVTLEGRDDIKPYIVVQAGDIRVALLGVLPKVAKMIDSPNIDVKIVSPMRRIRELSARILENGEANIVACFSTLPAKTNQELCAIPTLHFIIGSGESTDAFDRIVTREGTNILLQRTSGRAAGHTTIKVSDGDWNLADISQRHALPGQLIREQEALEEYIQNYGTDDMQELARLVTPNEPENFIIKLDLMAENAAWLETMHDPQGSYIDHRDAVLPDVPAGDPVRTILGGHGAALHAAMDGITRDPIPLDPKTSIPHPDSCKSCHSEQYAFWAATDHARSYDHLVERQRGFDDSCLFCHTSGYGMATGFNDPRLEAPLGSVSCYQCHEVKRQHVENDRLVVDPAYVGSDESLMRCALCHVPQRSPGFQRHEALDAVRCPPMRPDEPLLAQARTKALAAIERHRSRGGADKAWNSYLEGRALVGLGRRAEGLRILREFIQEENASPEMVVFTARYFDQHGDTRGGMQILRESLAATPGDLTVNLGYLELLIQAEDEDARDLELALSHARLIAPLDAPELQELLLPVYLIQVDVLMELGRTQDGYQAMLDMSSTFSGETALEERAERYGLIQKGL